MAASEWNNTDHHMSVLYAEVEKQFTEYWAIARKGAGNNSSMVVLGKGNVVAGEWNNTDHHMSVLCAGVEE